MRTLTSSSAEMANGDQPCSVGSIARCRVLLPKCRIEYDGGGGH